MEQTQSFSPNPQATREGSARGENGHGTSVGGGGGEEESSLRWDDSVWKNKSMFPILVFSQGQAGFNLEIMM